MLYPHMRYAVTYISLTDTCRSPKQFPNIPWSGFRTPLRLKPSYWEASVITAPRKWYFICSLENTVLEQLRIDKIMKNKWGLEFALPVKGRLETIYSSRITGNILDWIHIQNRKGSSVRNPFDQTLYLHLERSSSVFPQHNFSPCDIQSVWKCDVILMLCQQQL